MRESERAPDRVVDAQSGQREQPARDAVDARLALAPPSSRGTNVRMMAAVQRQAGNRAAQHVARRAQPVQRQPAPAPAPAAGADPASAGLIVEDSVTDLRPEQMRRGEFVRHAQAAAQEGTRAGLGPLAAQGEAELRATTARYAGQPAAQLEATARAEVAGAAAATSAAALVSSIREAANNEAKGRLAAGVSDTAARAVNAALDAASRAGSAITSLIFKPKAGSSPTSGPGEVGAAKATLGRGDAVPDRLRAEVEGVTGQDLSDVRLHTSGPAPEMADQLGARAFTVGNDIVVASGEPPTGTLDGDALLAHELAHAAQQSTATDTGAAAKSDAQASDLAELAADDVAADAVIGLWTGARTRLSEAGPTVAARVRTGLRLQRCGRAKIDPTKEELNKKVLEGMATANAGGDAKRGIHYPFNYKAKYPEEWKALGSPDDGHADTTYWSRVAFMHWVRKPGVSASKAMDAWFRGPTIADCASVATASEVNALRAALGDAKFDRLFGGEGKKPIAGPDGRRISLEIGQGSGSSVVADLMRATQSATDAGVPGKRNVQPGEWHYFANHPAYPKKHPTGYWQGENALFKGDDGGVQMWTGFGATYNEDGMNKALVDQYNLAPTPDDQAKRKDLYDKHGPNVNDWPPNVKKFHGEFPDQIEVPHMLAAGGGFEASAGKELDPAKVKALSDRPDLNE
jgi:hypothetical protein